MKALRVIIAVLCFLLPEIISGQDFRKLEDHEMIQGQIDFAKNFATDYFTALKNGSSFQFEDEATNEVKNQLTPEYQKSIYNQLKTNLGDFVSLEYSETWTQSKNQDLNIIRFKSVFEKTSQQIEVRVVLNKAGKIAGFFITPWKDSLN